MEQREKQTRRSSKNRRRQSAGKLVIDKPRGGNKELRAGAEILTIRAATMGHSGT
jgi:hypothetical protein